MWKFGAWALFNRIAREQKFWHGERAMALGFCFPCFDYNFDQIPISHLTCVRSEKKHTRI